ncbi:MAG: NAD+ synthase [Peptococcaceae bacterium]
MRIALVQLNPIIANIKYNTAKILQAIDFAGRLKADLVIFPELAIMGYPPRDLLWRQDILGQVETVLKKDIAPKSHKLGVLIGAPVIGSGNLYNAALLFYEGRLLGRQDKTLLPDYDVFEENRYFKPALKREPLLFKGVKLGLTVCEDIWNDKDYWNRRHYPVDPVEELIAQGADLIINISASPYHYGKIDLRSDMLQKMAAKYHKIFIYANQVGGNDELIFDGSSLAVNSKGEVIGRAGSFSEDMLFFSLCRGVKFNAPTIYLENWVKAKEEIFPEKIYYASSPEDIGCLYHALVLGIKDYLRKTGFKRVLVGLSGGIDSSVVAALSVAACGKENVLGVAMPSKYSSPGSLADARQLALNLGIAYREIPIQGIFDECLASLNKEDTPLVDLAEENIQARIRGNILMFISNREGYLTLSTGNKSELAVGYCTLYGDMCGGLAVISDVPKTMVYVLAKYINREWEIIPAPTLVKPPSAELRPDQTDQDSLPPYEILDAILHLYIEENKPAAEIIAAGYDAALVREIIQKIDRAEYKRRQAALGLKVTTKAFGMGRRIPIAWQQQ